MLCLLTVLYLVLPAWLHAERLMVGYGPDRDLAQLNPLLEQNGLELRRCFRRAKLCIVDAPVVDDAQLDNLRQRLGLRYIERDQRISVAPPKVVKNDSSGTDDCPAQWELEAVNAASAWSIAQGLWSPVVAIQDTGFLLSHQEIQGRISGQFDYGDLDTVPELSWNSTIPDHGTFIAAIIAGDPDNGRGRSGLAPYARLNLQKIADSNGDLFFSYAVAAMADLADGDLGVRVLNYSIAGPTQTESFRDAVLALDSVGILVVTAAGNCAVANCDEADNDLNPMFPGSYTFEHIITVAAASHDDGFNSFSHYGRNSVDLAAPGVDICSAGVRADDNYYTAGGTSYATPLVAASAALLLEAHPKLTTIELARVLRASARPSAAWTEKVRSGGVLDTAAALQTAVPRFADPGVQVCVGLTPVSLVVENVGAAGVACVVIDHDQGLDFVAVDEGFSGSCWARQHSADGQGLVSLFDAGELSASQGQLTVFCGDLQAHQTVALRLWVRGLALGWQDLHVRLVMASQGAPYLNSPYQAGENDQTGFLAWPQQWRVDTVAQDASDPCASIVDAGQILDAIALDAGGADVSNPISDASAATADASAQSDTRSWDGLDLDCHFEDTDDASIVDVRGEDSLAATDAPAHDNAIALRDDGAGPGPDATEVTPGCGCSGARQPVETVIFFGFIAALRLRRNRLRRSS